MALSQSTWRASVSHPVTLRGVPWTARLRFYPLFAHRPSRLSAIQRSVPRRALVARGGSRAPKRKATDWAVDQTLPHCLPPGHIPPRRRAKPDNSAEPKDTRFHPKALHKLHGTECRLGADSAAGVQLDLCKNVTAPERSVTVFFDVGR